MADSNSSELLPSVAQILKRAGALERDPGVDVRAVARLPVFQGRNWKRAIGEFLRWSGSTPEPWGSTSVFELLLCHGSAGARALFEAYRHDRLERAEIFQEAQSQLEAVRTVVSMASYWLHVISWDLRDAARLSAEEFQAFRRGRKGGSVGAAAREGFSGPRGEPRRSDLVEKFLSDEIDSRSGRAGLSPGIPIYPSDAAVPNLWKNAPEKTETLLAPGPTRWRPREPRT
jgi:hypothetical protein